MNSSISICAHVKSDGVRCGSPAVRGRPFCYFHKRYYDGTGIRPDRHIPVRDFPIIRNERDVNTSIATVLRGLREGRLTESEGHLMVQGIRLAADLMRAMNKQKRRSPR